MKKLEKPINNSILNILRKRSSKIKSYEVSSSKQPLKNQKDNNSPKKKNQSKDKDINSLITNIYHYFINDHTKLDELHVDLTEKIFNFQKDIDLPKKDGYYDQFDFLTDVEITEIKNNYKDFMLEDYLLIFPNPDQMKKDRAVTFKEALEVFDKALVGRSDETINKIQALKEKLAFIQAFQMLDDFVKEDGEDDEEDDEDLDEESPLKKKTKKKKSFFKSFFKRKREKKLAELKKISFFSRFFKKKNVSEETIQQDSEKKVFTKPISRALSIKLSEHENELLKKTSFTEEDLRELKMVFKKMQKMKIVKKFCKGQFLQKKAFVDKKDDGYDYVCKNTPAKDFLTLVRNVIITKLTMISKMHTRLFLSSTGKDILMVLKCDDNILKKQADLISMSKQMELGACDLLSLEPVDQLLRPFRLKNFVKMDENEYKESNQQGIKKKKWENNKKNKEETVDNLEALAGLFEESILNHENLLQESCREIYKRIQNINENQFRLLLVDKSCKINEHLRFLVKQYKIDMPDPNTEIQNDCLISRKEWAAYFIYLCYLEKYFDLLLSKLKKNQYIQENILFLLKLIFRKAVGDSNEIHDEFNKSNPLLVLLGIEKKKSILKTIWSKLRMDPSPPFSKFFISGSLKEKTKRNLWRTYEINEQNERSIFLNMEKMKLINDIILKNVNMVYLMKHLYIDSYFPLHNYYELNLKKTRNLFNSLVHSQLIVDKPPSEDFLKLNELFMDLADEAENTDFNSDGSCFEKETLFEIRRPWYISIETIRNYFGEKIAIYFSFLSFYTLEIGPMAFLGLFAQIFLYLDIQSDAIKLSFSILIIIWSTIFIEMWKRRQYMFAVKYGQLDFQEEEAERPDFKGEYTRSTVDDNLNLTYFNTTKKKMKMMFSFFVSVAVICIVIFCVYGIFYLKSLAYCYEIIDKVCLPIDNNDIVQILLTLLNTVQIVIFNTIYANLALKLNNFENHKLFSSYENSLVLKIFFFNFVNTFFSLIFVAFFNSVFPLLNLCKINDNCYDSLTRQMMIIFLTFFANNIVEILQPFILILLNQQAVKKKKDIKYSKNSYFLVNIDQEIEKDYMKSDYHPSLEIDGTVVDYMEMVMQFGFLNLFGMSFPLAFTLAFLNDIAEIQVDKMKLAQFKRRPIPKGAANIGTWLIILDLISFFAIFFNTGLIIITAQVASNSNISTLFLFVILLLIFLALKYFIRFLIPDIPQKANILTQRHKYVIEKCNKDLEIKKNVNYMPYHGSNKIENVGILRGESENQAVFSSIQDENYKKKILLQEINIDKKII